MSGSTQPWRKPARAPKGPILAPRFEGYPYLVSRIGRSAMRHIALLPGDWARERIVTLARDQAEANRLETVACFGPGDAVYVAIDNSTTREGPAPTGIYVIERLHLSEPVPESDELNARRAWLHAFAAADRSGRYVVGDGTNVGEPAQPEDRRRLGGRGPDGLPSGLRRCAQCDEAAGDYLRAGDEIVKVYCACENHNRCARCLLPLASHRLSAWFWDDELDKAWHVAAYSAFSHRCPDYARG